MPSNREHLLPSGARLHITTATFERAHELFKAYSEEMIKLKLDSEMSDIALDLKIGCTVLSSQRIENALKECMKSATYNGLPITLKTFEEPETWGDYPDVCLEVAKDNLNPLKKNLSARFPVAAEILRRFLA